MHHVYIYNNYINTDYLIIYILYTIDIYIFVINYKNIDKI